MQLFIDNLRQVAQKQNLYSPLHQEADSPVKTSASPRKQDVIK